MKNIIKIVSPFLNKKEIIQCVFLGIFSGLLNFLFVNLITKIVNLIVENKMNTISKELIIIFSISIVLFVWIKSTLSKKVIIISQGLFWNLRLNILRFVLKSDFSEFYKRKDKIYSAIVSDVNILTQVSLSSVDFCLSLIIMIACLVYMAFISVQLFFVTMSVLAFGSIIYFVALKENNKNFLKVRALENGFMGYFNALVNGYKEIYVEPKKGDFIYNNLVVDISKDAYNHNVSAYGRLLNSQMIGQLSSYFLTGLFLLVFSVIFQLKASTVVNFIFVLMYLMASIDTLMTLFPSFLRAKVAAEQITILKKELDSVGSRDITKAENTVNFETLSVTNLSYTYSTDVGKFVMGPVNLELNKGEVVFIYGSNGSGKTTFVYSLLGLLKPNSGHIKLNNHELKHRESSEYISNYAVVFSDYYLFNFSIDTISYDTDKCKDLLRLFEIDSKVSLQGNRFSNYNLSTGQRKRLALIGALMENKPILVLDEWAADQDPDFRKKFYTVILREIKKMGITVIAITHDDKYYYCADKLFKMEDGLLKKIKLKEPESII